VALVRFIALTQHLVVPEVETLQAEKLAAALAHLAKDFLADLQEDQVVAAPVEVALQLLVMQQTH
jgi:hypothetical protein